MRNFIMIVLFLLLAGCEKEIDPTYEVAILSFEAGYHTGVADGLRGEYEYEKKVKKFCEQLKLDSIYYKNWIQGK